MCQHLLVVVHQAHGQAVAARLRDEVPVAALGLVVEVEAGHLTLVRVERLEERRRVGAHAVGHGGCGLELRRREL